MRLSHCHFRWTIAMGLAALVAQPATADEERVD